VNAGTADLTELVRQVAELSRKVSCLTGRITVLGNRLDESGPVVLTHVFRLGMELGERTAAGLDREPAGPPPRPRHLKVVR
jgi:hypothetical protein